LNKKYLARASVIGVVIVGCAWVAVNLASLTTYPTPYPDDSLYGSVAETLRLTGRLGLPLYPDVYGSSQSVFHFGRLYVSGLAAWFTLLGTGLFQARLYVYVGSLLAVWLTYQLGKQLYSRTVGILAALFLLLCWRALWSSHSLRPDTYVNVGGLVLILAALRLIQSPRSWLSFFTGLLGVLILDIHLKALHYSLSTALMLLVYFGRNRSHWRYLVLLGMGALLAAVYWLAIHFLPDPLLMYQQWRLGLFSDVLSPGGGLVQVIADFLRALQLGILAATRLGWLEALYLMAGLTVVVYRRTPANRLLIGLLGAFTLSYIFLMPVKGPQHLYLFGPFFSLLMAAAITEAANRIPRLKLPPPVLAGLMAAPLLLAYLVGNLSLAWANRNIVYNNYASKLAALVPANASILGESTWWWQFRTGTYTADDLLSIQAQQLPVNEVEGLVNSIIEQRAINYILLDERISDSGSEVLYQAVGSYIARRCQPVGSVTETFYGVDQGGPQLRTTEVYQCR
jgi:hypothetical protein